MTQDENTRPEAPSATGKVIRRNQLAGLRRADQLIHDAEAERERADQDAKLRREIMMQEARTKALQDAAKAAAQVISKAEEEARQKVLDLEPQLARLVADTVRAIVGEMEPAEASYRAALNALQSLREHRMGRIYANSQTSESIRRAVADLPAGSAEVESIIIDDSMADGDAVLTSDRGHTDLGVKALMDTALAPWEEDQPE